MPLIEQGHLELVVQVCVLLAFEYLQGRSPHNLSGLPVFVLGHPQSEKVFPDIQRESLFVPITSSPVTGHH